MVTRTAWTDQVGPLITGSAAAELLGARPEYVAADPGLLRVPTQTGAGYPVIQFEGQGCVPGVAEVVEAMSAVAAPATVTAWLTSTQPELDGRRPIDALKQGDVEAVVTIARRFAARSAR